MHKGRLLGGILLVSGTTIGAGMLALPVSSGISGFYPSLLIFCLIWAFMLYTAFLMLEVALWMKGGSNLITMAEYTLGRFGHWIAWGAYLVLLYLLNIAYLSVGSKLMIGGFSSILGVSLPSWLGLLPFLLIFGSFVYLGTKAVDSVNRLFMMGLMITFAIIIIIATPSVDKSLLSETHYKYLPVAVSIIVTAFGFHIIIPSLLNYLDRDVRKVKTSIFIGSMAPLLVYIFWQFLVQGIVPIEGVGGLKEAWELGDSAIVPMQGILNTPTISLVANLLAFFAIVTSFLGVSLSLTDFLADGLKIKKDKKGKSIISLIAFLPPLIVALTYRRAFLSALGYAGAFGVVILLCILPAAMVWKGRYIMKIKGSFITPGGKGALIFVFAISSIIIILEIAEKLGILAASH